MELRPVQPRDLECLLDLDGTIESTRYLHLLQSGEGLCLSWALEERALREKLILPNQLDDELRFALKQIAAGIEEGMAIIAEHDAAPAALCFAQPEPETGRMRLLDLRVDYDFRRQGLATGMLYTLIQEARDRELRAVVTETRTNNHPANQLLLKCGFELGGVDTRRRSNHDVVKEEVTLIWYASLD